MEPFGSQPESNPPQPGSSPPEPAPVQPPAQNPPPGWYPDAQGVNRWWDGTQWGQAAVTPTPVAASGMSDAKSMAVLAQVLGILTGLIGPLIIYLVNGEKDPYVRHHSSEALNFQLTLLIAYLVSAVLILVLIGLLMFLVVWVLAIVWGIQAAIAANRGEWYRYPVSIRFVPGAMG
jgi:uncharacterized Tic20 family protein